MNPRHRQAEASSDSPWREPGREPLHWLEIATLTHVGLLLLLGSWAFGGGTAWARQLISCWGSLGWLITLAVVLDRRRWRNGFPRPLRWLWPFAAFNALVLLSCLNPSFSERFFAGQSLLAYTGAAHAGLPSTAHPPTSLEHLWLFDAIYLSCFNLILVVRRRRGLRVLLVVACANAVLLSVFGTFQNLTADGLYFGRVPSPNPRFFSTFVYANHWAAFVLLFIAACAGLIFYRTRHQPVNRLAGSPLAMGIVGLLLMAMTPTIGGSRSGTLLVMILLGGCVVHAFIRIVRQRRSLGESAMLPLSGVALCVLLAAGAAVYLGRATLRERWRDTQGQWQAGMTGERLRLYADTWHLAAARPFSGWGLGCFDKALLLVRPRPLEARRQYEHSYVDAHSDWLQSLAEVGFAGTILIGLCGLLPLQDLRTTRHLGSLSAYLLAGCGLILFYAVVEFPFGNPAVVIAFWTCFFCAVRHGRRSDCPPGVESSSPASPVS